MKLNRTLRVLLILLFSALLLAACSMRPADPEETKRPADTADTDKPGDTVKPSVDPETQPVHVDDPGTPANPSGDPVTEPETTPAPVEVIEPSPYAPPPDATADFSTDGIFIYGDAVYAQVYYSEANSNYYAQTALYYQMAFGCPVSIVIAPMSSMTIDNPTVKSKIPDQKQILDDMKALVDPSVRFVNTYDPILAHRVEYLYFRSDHHWTQRGAYYAYAAFAEAAGFTPTPLSSFEKAIRNPQYYGSWYSFTLDERVKNFVDEIEVYYPTKAHTMTVETPQGVTMTYATSIIAENTTYVTFIAGDNPYTVIDVPDNPQDKICLVMKDSYGNALVPFLCEHYGKIIVADPRYETGNLLERLKDVKLTDIIFVNSIENANAKVWSQLYMGCLGVTLP